MRGGLIFDNATSGNQITGDLSLYSVSEHSVQNPAPEILAGPKKMW